MKSIWELLLRVLISIVVLIVFARIDGPKQISQLTFFDYIVGITVGSIAGTLCLDRDIPIYYGVIAIVLYLLSSMFVSFLTNKSIILRRVLTGAPIIVVEEGEIMYKALKRARLDINDLLRELRSQGYFNITEIHYAILESNGHVSVMPKGYARPSTNDDLGIKADDEELGVNVIMDGKILKGNLGVYDKDIEWLRGELKKQGIENLKEVMLATLNTDNELSVFMKNKQNKKRTSLM